MLLGHSLAMRDIFVQQHKKLNDNGIVIENVGVQSTDVFLRSIISGPDPVAEHEKELVDDVILAQNTKYTADFYKWFTNHEGNDPRIAFSKSSASFYNHNGTPVVAFRIYLLGVNNTSETINFLIDYIIDAKKEFDQAQLIN
ncbi:MAG: hypothetical protein JWO54_966 [Candidatus Saccharibacteria bacterium]|nr:hypothetical protein [Candidatus Saccharibacteria bacterium]